MSRDADSEPQEASVGPRVVLAYRPVGIPTRDIGFAPPRSPRRANINRFAGIGFAPPPKAMKKESLVGDASPGGSGSLPHTGVIASRHSGPQEKHSTQDDVDIEMRDEVAEIPAAPIVAAPPGNTLDVFAGIGFAPPTLVTPSTNKPRSNAPMLENSDPGEPACAHLFAGIGFVTPSLTSPSSNGGTGTDGPIVVDSDPGEHVSSNLFAGIGFVPPNPTTPSSNGESGTDGPIVVDSDPAEDVSPNLFAGIGFAPPTLATPSSNGATDAPFIVDSVRGDHGSLFAGIGFAPPNLNTAGHNSDGQIVHPPVPLIEDASDSAKATSLRASDVNGTRTCFTGIGFAPPSSDDQRQEVSGPSVEPVRSAVPKVKRSSSEPQAQDEIWWRNVRSDRPRAVTLPVVVEGCDDPQSAAAEIGEVLCMVAEHLKVFRKCAPPFLTSVRYYTENQI
ncbi:hypothetical protein EUX98_g8971 [Antrodiella citrinella]|uniref:Uncharacterized protein n=1 Tax=Antrodiella citrinella TaxID=2447956 RepID=A0A4S4M1N4_9APHY|nr:hypothetical protein EUX98_g8971 [Antrodiella citrinella]